MRLSALLLLALSSCATVIVEKNGEGGSGDGTTTGCVPATPQIIADQMGADCSDCDQQLTRQQAVTLIMDHAKEQGKHAGYYPPVYPTFQDVSETSTVEEGVFAQVVLPEPYDGTAEFYPNDTADSCFTQELVDRVLALPTLFITPLESFPGFEAEAFDGSKTEVMSYTLHGSSKESPLYYVRVINDPSNQFVSGSPTSAVDKVYVTCQSGDFASERLIPWPMNGDEALAEAPENCYDHGEGVTLVVYVSPAFAGSATVGLALSSPVRKWPNWQDTRLPAMMTVK